MIQPARSNTLMRRQNEVIDTGVCRRALCRAADAGSTWLLAPQPPTRLYISSSSVPGIKSSTVPVPGSSTTYSSSRGSSWWSSSFLR